MNKKLKIIYMGTPGFAVEPLRVLLNAGYNVAAVVTSPDKPAGRGLEMKMSEVKQFAVENSLPVMQPEKLRDENFIDTLKSLNADIFIVVAFRMLPETVWSIPPYGTINLHASLLPDYRGAAPINHAIINGETETGVTTFLISHEIDTGNILLRRTVKIENEETAGELHDKLMVEGSSLLLETLDALEKGNITPIPQPEQITVKSAPKLFHENCTINWNSPTENVRNLIRGLNPYPGARCEFSTGDKLLQFKIFRASTECIKHNDKPGKILSDGKTFIKIACNDGYLNLEELQMQGKKIMPVKVFLSGFRGKLNN